MRPYLALIKDSFRAAFASNVLYLLLALITCVLLAVAPLHVREILDWKIRFGESNSVSERVARYLVERGENEKYPKVMRVWSKLKPKTQENVRKWVEIMDDESVMPIAEERTIHIFSTKGELQTDLNKMIKDRKFYDSDVWNKDRLRSEAKELAGQEVENLSDGQSRRLNRLLIANALPRLIDQGAKSALELRYATWGFWDFTFNLSQQQFSKIATTWVTWVFDWVLWVGLILAILVTANIIPETFLPGSLNLLLSKPISRWGLLVAKFIGGCAYVSLCSIYLFLGVWLWMGLAFGVWEPRILWAIPLYIIVFAIYYSVSTLIGVWSRSQILAIVVTVLFGAICFGVGSSYMFAKNYLSHNRPSDLIPVESQLLHVGKLNAVSRWDESTSQWNEVLAANIRQEQAAFVNLAVTAQNADQGGSGDIERLGPVFDPRSNLIVSGMLDFSDMGSFNYQDLYVSEIDKVRFRKIGKFPRNSVALFTDRDGAVVVSSTGKFLRLNEVSVPADASGETQEKGNQISRALSKKNEPFTDVSPKTRSSGLSSNRVAYNPSTRSISTLSGKQLQVFRLADDGKYELAVEKDVTEWFLKGLSVIVKSGGDAVVLALGNGEVVAFDESTLEHQKTLLPQSKSRFKLVAASNDGRYFVFVCYNKTLWVLDAEKPDSIVQPKISEQGTVTAIRFDGQGQLWVGDTSNFAKLYNLESLEQLKELSPKSSLFTMFYNYCLSPSYWLCPKPGEFYKVIAHVSGVADGAVEEDEVPDSNLSRDTSTDDPWQPLWSGLLFMFVTLFVASVIFIRRDF